MAYLNKDQYYARQQNAVRRMQENSEIETLTEDQHNQLAKIAGTRHWMHTHDGKDLFCTEGADYEELSELFSNFIGEEENFARMIKNVGIDYDTSEIWQIISDYEDADNDQSDEYSENEEERETEMNEAIEYCGELLSRMNRAVEAYLAHVDKNYGTDYCPTGALRI